MRTGTRSRAPSAFLYPYLFWQAAGVTVGAAWVVAADILSIPPLATGFVWGMWITVCSTFACGSRLWRRD